MKFTAATYRAARNRALARLTDAINGVTAGPVSDRLDLLERITARGRRERGMWRQHPAL